MTYLKKTVPDKSKDYPAFYVLSPFLLVIIIPMPCFCITYLNLFIKYFYVPQFTLFT